MRRKGTCGRMLVDVRCDGTAKSGPRKGGPCNYLLHRIDPTTQGEVETKCPRCNQVRPWFWYGTTMLVASTA